MNDMMAPFWGTVGDLLKTATSYIVTAGKHSATNYMQGISFRQLYKLVERAAQQGSGTTLELKMWTNHEASGTVFATGQQCTDLWEALGRHYAVEHQKAHDTIPTDAVYQVRITWKSKNGDKQLGYFEAKLNHRGETISQTSRVAEQPAAV